MKIALICNFLHEYTTATYFEEVFIKLGIEHKRFHYKHQRKIPKDFDLYFYVDDATEYVLYPNPRVKKIFYLTDTHRGIADDLTMIKYADMVFCAQENAQEEIRKHNPNVMWLPLACSEAVHCCPSVAKKYDVAFIGGMGSGRRKEYLELLKGRLKNSYFGLAEKSDIGRIYSAAKIVFNVSLLNDLNMRFFEGMCSGSLLLTDEIKNNGMELIDRQMENPFYVKYSDQNELLDKIDFFLADENASLREEIAKRGKQFSLKNTYEVRWNVIADLIPKIQIAQHSRSSYLFDILKLFAKKVLRKIQLRCRL